MNISTHILNAEVFDSKGNTYLTHIAIVDGHIVSLADHLAPLGNVQAIDAKGALLIPGLHDHHAHFLGYAASLASVRCGPPDIETERALISALHEHEGDDWLRGTGFHESVLEHLDRQWLDINGPVRPIRIQHRSGRLWVLNSLALNIIDSAAQKLTTKQRARLSREDGRLFDVDDLLGTLTRKKAPPISRASRQLAAYGVTGINDMTPANDGDTWDWFNTLQHDKILLQKVRMSGRASLNECAPTARLSVGETKVHLHDSELPEFDHLVSIIQSSHADQRNIAVHCVTEVELVFTLSAFQTAGSRPGDRIEHGSIMPPALIEQIKALGLNVVTQPNFISERGDAYLKDVPVSEHAHLYRVRSLMDANVPIAFGTDLPFGHPDPWAAMSAATRRATASGQELNPAECVTPEMALSGFLGELSAPFSPRCIRVGMPADCCLLDLPWDELRHDLASDHVRMTFCDGELIYQRNE